MAMKFSRLAFLFFLISTQLCALTVVQSAEPLQCESNSTYENNLHNLFSIIKNDTQIDYGFYNVSYGENPDQVNAIGLCRGDLKPDSCRSCIGKATDDFTKSCDNHREAIVWYDDCMLRFSNRSIFGQMEFVPYRALVKVNNSTNETEFNQVLATLLAGLITQAASGDSHRKFATGDAAVSDSLSIYALVQCTPDLSQVDCNNCLYNATNLLSLCCSGKQGSRVLTPSCNIRYDKDIFYGPSAAMPPAPIADAPVSPPVDAPTPVPVDSPPSFDAPPPVEVPPSVDAPPVTSAPPPGQTEHPDIGEGNMNSGFQALATIVPLMILQDLLF